MKLRHICLFALTMMIANGGARSASAQQQPPYPAPGSPLVLTGLAKFTNIFNSPYLTCPELVYLRPNTWVTVSVDDVNNPQGLVIDYTDQSGTNAHKSFSLGVNCIFAGVIEYYDIDALPHPNPYYRNLNSGWLCTGNQADCALSAITNAATGRPVSVVFSPLSTSSAYAPRQGFKLPLFYDAWLSNPYCQENNLDEPCAVGFFFVRQAADVSANGPIIYLYNERH